MNPNCPVCEREMQLKQVFRQQPSDHHVFKCKFCELEYPVVVQALAVLVSDESNG
jgi:transcription elongation factor Elf1